MKVTMTIKFSEEDLFALVEQELSKRPTPCQGYYEFELGPAYDRHVKAIFHEGVRPETAPPEAPDEAE